MTIIIVATLIVIVFLATAFIGAPYVPSHRKQVVGLFDDLYKIKKSDVVVDIGSGDGVVLREVAIRGGVAVGYEINPILVLISWIRLYKYRKTTSVKLANFWRVKFPETTTLVYTFGESRDINKMYSKVQEESTRLNKSLYFVSYGFRVKNRKPTKTHKAHHLYKITPLQ